MAMSNPFICNPAAFEYTYTTCGWSFLIDPEPKNNKQAFFSTNLFIHFSIYFK